MIQDYAETLHGRPTVIVEACVVFVRRRVHNANANL